MNLKRLAGGFSIIMFLQENSWMMPKFRMNHLSAETSSDSETFTGTKEEKNSTEILIGILD